MIDSHAFEPLQKRFKGVRVIRANILVASEEMIHLGDPAQCHVPQCIGAQHVGDLAPDVRPLLLVVRFLCSLLLLWLLFAIYNRENLEILTFFFSRP